MVQPKYTPGTQLNLRVPPELMARLDELVTSASRGLLQPSRHALALWCLGRGLEIAEHDPAALLGEPAAKAPAKARKGSRR